MEDKDTIPEEHLRRLYISLVTPHIDYCSTVWGLRQQSHTDKIRKLQNRATRVILRADWRTPTVALLTGLNVMPIKQRLQYNKLVLVHKCLNGEVPEYMGKRFKHINEVSSRRTRASDSNNLYIPKHRTGYMEHSLTVSGSKLYNALPADLRSLTIGCFKIKLKKHLTKL